MRHDLDRLIDRVRLAKERQQAAELDLKRAELEYLAAQGRANHAWVGLEVAHDALDRFLVSRAHGPGPVFVEFAIGPISDQ